LRLDLTAALREREKEGAIEGTRDLDVFYPGKRKKTKSTRKRREMAYKGSVSNKGTRESAKNGKPAH